MSNKNISQNQLPKIFNNRPIRLRPLSKNTRRAQSGKNFYTLSHQKRNNFQSPRYTQKTNSQKSKRKYDQSSEENIDIQQIETEPKKCLAQFKKNYQDDLIKLDRIAKLFDPKNLMKIKQKRNNGEKTKDKKNIKLGCNFFEYQKIKKSHKKNKQRIQRNRENKQEQYWKTVNQSMIVACRNQQEISKDLRDIMETFITQ